MHMFREKSDFEEFERAMVQVHLRQPIRILSYCVLLRTWFRITSRYHDVRGRAR
jgi:hypothetical protein